MDAKLDPRDALERALLAAMAGRQQMRWGVDDCALWCANIIQEALGYDPAAAWRGRYRSRRGALRVLGRAGLLAAIEGAAAVHGWRHIDPGTEAKGDIGLMLVDGVPSTVICRAPGWFIGRNEGGWTALQGRHLQALWAVA
ncbi:DUF6950 family protein (plasmid) [Bradyrhizobium oligotrophicum S58]